MHPTVYRSFLPSLSPPEYPPAAGSPRLLPSFLPSYGLLAEFQPLSDTHQLHESRYPPYLSVIPAPHSNRTFPVPGKNHPSFRRQSLHPDTFSESPPPYVQLHPLTAVHCYPRYASGPSTPDISSFSAESDRFRIRHDCTW